MQNNDFSFVLKKASNIVITGDSLSYNRYDYMNTPRTNAWECYSGMESWSFKIRDYVIRNQEGFIKGRDLNIDKEFSYFCENSFNCLVPFLYEGICIFLEKNEVLELNEYKGKYLYYLDDINLGGKININGEIINTKSDFERYHGHEVKCIRIDCEEIKCLDENTRFNIIGIGNAGSEVYLTGSGCKTGEWLLENLNERILKYNPDLTIMIIGANNRRENNPSSFKAALNEIITRLIAKGVKIILISPPHSTTTDPVWAQDNIYECAPNITKPILDILKKISFDYNLPYLNLFEFFSGEPSDHWRFDDTHFTRQGNLALYKALVKQFFTEM